MKTVLMAVLTVLCVSTAKAQNWDEWFRQKATQKKYLIQQIAALKVYTEYAKKGYDVAKSGLTNIGNSALQEFKAHTNYYNSLQEVNPEVAKYQTVQEINKIHQQILTEVGNTMRAVRVSPYFTIDEKDYIKRVLSRIRQDSDAGMDELSGVITRRHFQATDADRVQRIEQIHEDMQRRYGFCKQFATDIKLLHQSRLKNKSNADDIRGLYGLKK